MDMKKNSPHVTDVIAGDYYWCSCGESANHPYCDGSHARLKTGKSPVKVTIDKDRKVAWCCCKRSGNGPFCDGSHSRA